MADTNNRPQPKPLSERIRAQFDATGHVSPDMIEEVREMEKRCARLVKGLEAAALTCCYGLEENTEAPRDELLRVIHVQIRNALEAK